MKELLPVLLLAMAGIVAYHTATHGRRGRWWGRSRQKSRRAASWRL